jgi:hypothetical protein
MRVNQLSLVIAAAVGGAAIQLVFQACGSVKGASMPADARADSATASAIGQIVYADTAAVILGAGAGTIAFDNTIPQQSEGSEFLTATITPASASSFLLVEVVAWLSESANHSNQIVGAVFRDGGADAIVAGWASIGFQNVVYGGANNYSDSPLVLRVRVPSGSTSPTTFKLRGGCDSGPAVLNGLGNVTMLGGSVRTTITVTELAP